MGDIFQSQYPELETIAQSFKKQAEEIAQMTGNIRGHADQLIEGDWRGEGSAAFSSTVRGQLMPALSRLEAALEAGSSLTTEVSKLIRDAEEEAARVFEGAIDGMPGGGNGSGPGSGNGSGPGSGNGSGPGSGIITKDKSLAAVLLTGLAKGIWQGFKDRNLWRGLLGGARFVRGANGSWIVKGPAAALRAMGLNPNIRTLTQEFIKQNIDNAGFMNGLKNVFKPGGLSNMLKNITTTPGIQPVAKFMDNFKGGAIIGGLVTLGSNIYEFGWGNNQHLGLGSRQFITSTAADLVATGGIVAASTAIGTMIPVPGVGTAVGFVVGVGLQYAYDNWGKEHLRNAFDAGGKWLQENVPAAVEGVRNFGSNVIQGASDVAHSIGNGISNVGSSIKDGLSSAASWIGL